MSTPDKIIFAVYFIGFVVTLIVTGWMSRDRVAPLDFQDPETYIGILFAVFWPLVLLIMLFAGVSALLQNFGIWLGGTISAAIERHRERRAQRKAEASKKKEVEQEGDSPNA